MTGLENTTGNRINMHSYIAKLIYFACVFITFIGGGLKLARTAKEGPLLSAKISPGGPILAGGTKFS